MRIAVASGKGGTGKTLVAGSLFHSLSEAGYKVALADCDAEEPNDRAFFPVVSEEEKVITQKVPVIDTDKCTFCGRCHDYCNYNAIFILPPANFIQVIEDLCHGCGACSVACKDGAISEKEVPLGTVSTCKLSSDLTLVEGRMKVGVFSPVSVIKATVRHETGATLTILDSPPGTSCPFIQTVSVADYVILVTEPTPFGLSDLRQSVETLRSLNKDCGVIINRAGLGNRAVYDYLKEEKLELLMEIPFSRELAERYAEGNLFTVTNPEWQEKFTDLYRHIEAAWK